MCCLHYSTSSPVWWCQVLDYDTILNNKADDIDTVMQDTDLLASPLSVFFKSSDSLLVHPGCADHCWLYQATTLD